MSKNNTEKSVNSKGHGLYFAWLSLLVLGTVGTLGLLGISYPAEYAVYALCGLVVLSGIAFMIGYFKGEFFKNMHNADYALGLVLIVVGLVFGVQPELVTPLLPLVYGFIELYLGAFVLQAFLASRRLYCSNWGVIFVISVPAMACSLYTLIFNEYSEYYDVQLYYGLMCVSAGLTFLAIFFNWIAVLRYETNYKKLMNSKMTAAQLLLESQPEDELTVKVSRKAKRAEKKAEKLAKKQEQKAAKEEEKASKKTGKTESAPAAGEDIFQEEDMPVKVEAKEESATESTEDIFVDEDEHKEDNDKVIPILKSASNA